VRPREQSKLADAICCLAKESSQLRAAIEKEIKWARSRHGLATKKNIEELGKKIIMANTEQYRAIKSHLEKLEKSFGGVSEDVDLLVKKVTDLQNSQGGVTPEDQGLINEIEDIATRLSTKAEALDALNENPPPLPP
jgi:chromosome segregation ATPase